MTGLVPAIDAARVKDAFDAAARQETTQEKVFVLEARLSLFCSQGTRG
jgi:hypothetical protein